MDEQTNPQPNISISGISGGGEIDIYTYFTASPYFAGFTSHNSPEMKIFLGLYRTLPDSLRQFIASDETALTIFTTGQSFNLDDGQIFNLARTIRELLIGNIFIKDFPITISSKLGIDDIKAGEIANKIISKSFGPIIEDVKRIQRSKFPDKIAQIQKSSQPTGLTQPNARPLTSGKPEVSPRSEDRPPIQSAPAQAPQPPKPYTYSPSQNMRPPVLPTSKPPEAEPQSKPQLQPLPATKQTPKPQFKVPDLSGMMPPPQTPSGKAGESLEKELEQVANIIDLRNKPPEK